MQKADPTLNRDLAAAYLSVVPGLGHIYKHQFGAGFFYLLVITPVVLAATAFLAPATFGLALLIIPALLIGYAGFDAFQAPDRSHSRQSQPRS